MSYYSKSSDPFGGRSTYRDVERENSLTGVICGIIGVFTVLALGVAWWLHQPSVTPTPQDSAEIIERSSGAAPIKEIVAEEPALVSQVNATGVQVTIPYEQAVRRFLFESEVNGVSGSGQNSRIVLNGDTFASGDTVVEHWNLVYIGLHQTRQYAIFQGSDGKYYPMEL